MEEPNTLSDLALEQAVAQQVRADLVMDAVTPGSETRLISRFLGWDDGGRLAMEVPRTPKGARVFVPRQWVLGVAFELSDLWLQIRTRVLDHGQFPLGPLRRTDAIIVEHPENILSCNRRRGARHRANPDRPIWVRLTVLAGPGGAPDKAPALTGRLRDWSIEGLGLEFDGSAPLVVGMRVGMRLDLPRSLRDVFVTGSVRHCTAVGEDRVVVGLDEVRQVPSIEEAARELADRMTGRSNRSQQPARQGDTS